MDKSVTKLRLALCLLVFFVMPGLALADDVTSREYKIKAAYLYNLIKFIHWPTRTSRQSSSQDDIPQLATSICVYGKNPFSQHLNKLTTRQAKGRPIEISYIKKEEKLPRCDIVFIAKDSQFPTEILNELFKQPLLTVGESRSFLNSGGIIGLVVKNNKVQLQINLTQAKTIGFEISGNLLEIAKYIK
ncbi:MAG: YfiR family protein [Pseudomonadales bacterium]